MAILDSCYSGGMKDGKQDVTKDPPVGKVIVLASSGTNQVSFGTDKPTPDHNHSYFTWALIAGLANNGKGYARADNLLNLQNEPRPGARDGKVTVKEWFDYQMDRGERPPGQTPEIIDSQAANVGQNVVMFEYDNPGQANNLKEHGQASTAAASRAKCDPAAVGGTVVLNATESNSQAANAGRSGLSLTEVATAGASSAVLLTAAGWYVRRRRLRQSRD